jgi:CheY-like chemotaxis protein
VLVVDDNRDCADTLVTLLRLLGHEGLATYDADSGLAAALTFLPDLVLLDLAMPAKDGFALLRELRSISGRSDVPIIAQTGYADTRHHEKAAEAGFNAYLVKPCGLEDLRMALLIVEGPSGDKA